MATIFRYPLDPTGVNVGNLVVGEVHSLPNRSIRAFAPMYGAFFTESVVIKDTASGEDLTSNQYKAVELYEFPTARYGKEICGVILIMDPTVSNNIEVSYQALGGDYGTNTDAILSMINSISLDNRPVGWPDIIGKPPGFVPAMHYHDIGDVYGFEYLVHALERVRMAITEGDVVGHEAIFKYIDDWGSSLSTASGGVSTSLSTHLLNTANPHSTTKAQVGLGNVSNFAVGVTADAQAGTSNSVYMTPALVNAAITTFVPPLIAAHTSRVDNPHATTKAQVGLGSVENFGLATTATAQAGTNPSQYMTPLLTANAISSQVPPLIAVHNARVDNPHNTTASQVGLGSVQNFALATTAQAQAGTNTGTYMTPQLTSAAITTLALTPLNTHTARVDNPHAVTAAQVLLGNVPNYSLATIAQAQAGSINTAFMTPSLTMSAIQYMQTNQQVAFAGDVVFSALQTIPTNARRIWVQGQAISLTTYPSLLILWCGAGYNALNADANLQADFFYRCTDAANPSTTRSNTGTFLVLPPAGYFLRPYNGQATGLDALRGRYKLQASDNLSHTHYGVPVNMFDTDRGGSSSLFSVDNITTTSASGGTESRPNNWPVFVFLVY